MAIHSDKRMKRLFLCLIPPLLLAIATSGLAVAAGCPARQGPTTVTTGSSEFHVHTETARQRIRAHLSSQTTDPDGEAKWNVPFELRPTAPTTRAILLVHGLGIRRGPSPMSRSLADQGYVVRALLLPGHGTTPADLIGVRLEDWQRLVRDQIRQLPRDFPEVWLGGFSTGANLVLEHALDDIHIRGLLLFCPALRSNEFLDWATPWLARVYPWLLSPEDHPLQSPLRYHIVPTDGLAQFYRSDVAVRERLKSRVFDRPAVIVLAQQDSVVDVHYVRHIFERRFTHAASRLIWYGSAPSGSAPSARILLRTDNLPQERISQFSHMGGSCSHQTTRYMGGTAASAYASTGRQMRIPPVAKPEKRSGMPTGTTASQAKFMRASPSTPTSTGNPG